MNTINSNVIQFIKKTTISLTGVLLFAACSTNQLSVQIPAQQQVIVNYPKYDVFEAQLKNKSFSLIAISVKSKTNKKIKKFWP